jgi:HEAT repeat protein
LTHSLLERLTHSDPAERRAACEEAARDPSAVLWIEALGEALGDPDKAVARAASDALSTIGRTAPEVGDVLRGALDVLRGALHADDPVRRWGAAFTFARLEPPGEKLLPALVEALGFPDGDLRWAAAKLLVETGRLAAPVLPLLLGLVREGEHPVVRRMATYCLRELAPDQPEAAAALLEASRDRDRGLHRAGLTALAVLVEPPAAVVERLVEALGDDPDPASRRIAAAALGEIGATRSDALPAPARAALEGARRSAPDCELRSAAARALARLGAAESDRSDG